MKRIWWLVLKCSICLLFVAAAAVSYNIHKSNKEKEKLSMKNLLPEFSANAPAEIIISWKQNTTTLFLKDGNWYIRERGNHKADVDMVTRFIEGIQKIRPLRRAVPADDQVISMLRLKTAESDPKKIPGVRVQIKDKNGKFLRNITLGAGYFNEATMMPGREPDPSGRWAGIIQENGSIVPVLISSMFEEFTPVPGRWLSCPVFDNIKQMTYISYSWAGKGGSWTIFRSNEKEPFRSIRPVVPQKRDALLRVLSQRYIFEGIRKEQAGKLTPIGQLYTIDSTGLKRVLFFYLSDHAKGGILCEVAASNKKDPSDKRITEFLDGREGWLYLIPDKLFEVISKNPAGVD